MNKNTCVPIIDVYWKGPYKKLELENIKYPESQVLYQVYGEHPAYGPNSLLYIGLTTRKVTDRLIEHDWIDNQCDECLIYVASCRLFENWNKWEGSGAEYDPYSNDPIPLDKIESLLIFSHQPSYNSSNISSLGEITDHFRIFNTGKRKSLDKEISTQFYLDIKSDFVKETPSGVYHERTKK